MWAIILDQSLSIWTPARSDGGKLRPSRSLPGIIFLCMLLSGAPLWSASPQPAPQLIPSPCAIRHPSDSKVEWECRRLQKGETLENLFGKRWVDVARFNRIDRRHASPGIAIKVPKHLEDITDFTPMPFEYSPAKPEAKLLLLDLSEQFLGAYEFGRLVFSAPITSGRRGNETPTGEFRISAADPRRQSTLYTIENTDIPYPMNHALRFHIDQEGVGFWIHGRDLPGAPVSHGCVGLYDEAMQKHYYGVPQNPILEDAKKLYEWVIAPLPDEGKFLVLQDGPKVLIVGKAPGIGTSPAAIAAEGPIPCL